MNSTPEGISTLRWLGAELLKFVTSPGGVLAGALDAARGWKYSRKWLNFWFHVPSLIVVVAIYLVFLFSMFERVDSQVQRFSVQSQAICPTKKLEQASAQQFSFLDSNTPSDSLQSNAKPNDLVLRYVELLSKRVLSIQPRNAPAHYRLGLVYSLTNQMDKAEHEISELAKGVYGRYQPANAWMSAWMIQQLQTDKDKVDSLALERNLEIAVEWKDTHHQILTIYSRILEANGNNAKAIAVAKEAANRRRENHLELLRLYHRLKNEDGIREASYTVEEVFGARLNTSSEKDSDRLAVAEARFLSGKYLPAVAVLQEGLSGASAGSRPALSRALSTIRLSMFEQSIRKLENGSYEADLSLLELAAEADPTDPKFSENVARLLPLNLKPTKKIVEVLKKQIDEGITTAQSHTMLADGYFMMKNVKEAIRNWELALSKNPKDVTACNNLALCLAKESKNNIPRSIELIQKALALEPNHAELLDTYGEILLIAGKPKEAINKLEASVRADGKRLGTRKKLVTAYNQVGMKDLAESQSKIIEKMTANSESSSDKP